MGFLNNLLNKIETLDPDALAQDTMASNTEPLEELQRQQMLKGLDADGNRIGQYKSEAYATIKNQQNPLAGFPFIDLKRKGDYHKSITASIVGDQLIIESTDEKAEKIFDVIKREEQDILGLDREHSQELINDHLRPTFNNLVESRTGLKFNT